MIATAKDGQEYRAVATSGGYNLTNLATGEMYYCGAIAIWTSYRLRNA